MNRQIARHKFCTGKRKDVLPFNSCHIETVVCLSKKNMKPKDYIEIGVNAEDYYKIKEGK